ncbi:hypothetical protein, partial [Candidatus Mycoplasma haematobovis]|uniref:hypothetical protein n=1 Tax=Candidatus Mycoplasma haematobovis TaxID=432608 RepID=UPI001C9C6147
FRTSFRTGSNISLDFVNTWSFWYSSSFPANKNLASSCSLEPKLINFDSLLKVVNLLFNLSLIAEGLSFS